MIKHMERLGLGFAFMAVLLTLLTGGYLLFEQLNRVVVIDWFAVLFIAMLTVIAYWIGWEIQTWVKMNHENNNN